MQVTCPNCGTEFQVTDSDSQKFAELADCILEYANDARELQEQIDELKQYEAALKAIANITRVCLKS